MQVNAISTNQWSMQGVGHGRPPGADPQKLADALGVSVDDIRQAAQNGQSLADLAKSKGISSDTLLEAVKTQISSAGQATGRAQLSDDQLTKMATDMINRVPGKGGPPPGGPSGGGQGADGTSAAGGSMDLSKLQELLRSLSEGDADDEATEFSQLLSKLGNTGSSPYGTGSVGLDQLA